jgi:hypothetical protein
LIYQSIETFPRGGASLFRGGASLFRGGASLFRGGATVFAEIMEHKNYCTCKGIVVKIHNQ